MKEQKKLTYYLAYLTEETLFAYGDFYEFFRMFDRKNRQWLISKITFSQLLHDFCVKEIDGEKAKELTGNNLPENAYQDYCEKFSARK